MENRFKPILFSTPMVQAIQEGTKTQTRRTKGLELINSNPFVYKYLGFVNQSHIFSRKTTEVVIKNPIKCPYTIGDILWVRETFYKPINEELNGKYFYKADLEKLGWNFKWKPSLFMPREACRIFLKITNIRAERLCDISKEDAMKEGVAFERIGPCDEYRDYRIKENKFDLSNYTHTFPESPIRSFFSLWQSINGSESLGSNPWVWVIEFEKVERPNDFLL